MDNKFQVDLDVIDFFKRENVDDQDLPELISKFGIDLLEKGYNHQAEKYLMTSLELAKKNNNTDLYTKILSNLSTLYTRLGMLKKAQAMAEKAYDLSEKLNNIDMKVASLNNIANVQYNIGNYAEANKYYLKIYNMRTKIGDKSGIAASLSNIANIKSMTGELLEAKTLYERSLEISRELNDSEAAAKTLLSLSTLLLNIGEYNNAKNVLEMGTKIIEGEIDDYIRIPYLINYSVYELYSNNIARGVEYIKKALKIVYKIGAYEYEEKIYMILLFIRNKLIYPDGREYNDPYRNLNDNMEIFKGNGEKDRKEKMNEVIDFLEKIELKKT